MKTERQISKDVMTNYLKYVEKDTSDGEIFSMTRSIQMQTDSTDVKFTNWDEFYWFMKDYRDELKNG